MRFKKAKREEERRPPTTIDDLRKIFTNPTYCGLVVHPSLIDQRDVLDKETYIEVAGELIRQMGIETFLNNLLRKLEDPSFAAAPQLVKIKIDQAYAVPRTAIVSEKDFIQAAVNLINDRQMQPEEYVSNLLDNLAGNWYTGE